ncbi:hypothetical protein VOLCADRAFT_104628 [Volvox carteri f. nagariensis]|uniref:Uncharacterized protein n=1 Tax=Volvox carteri f. nagariensis TaxID=3068 RepID=D8TV01_VOLCA|nr:uncharacterized protein VOLCADRAFT_104628 [Volvox carteri f. nagariensis]EFJ48909.1 hypothetical protein VOLCADRAFT_104628 [Volvox carteri f. nagariensis]|eukprot:XP_002950241.1 hypothetical protein VOLCADRAFT_104628 [Volvox carteri f. nagariensis]
MQQQITRGSALLADSLRARWPPPAHLRGSRKPLPIRRAFAKDAQSIPGDSSAQGSPAAPAAVPVIEATVLEPGTAPTDSDVATSGSDQTEALEHPDYPEVPAATNRAAALQYGVLGAVYAVTSGALATAALQAPAALGVPGGDPWVSTLLGCLAATYLRVAGVCLHLKGAGDNEELLCWRHQRLAMMAAVYGIAAALSQAAGVASLQLAGLQVLLSAATAAVVVHVARSSWAVRPFVVTVWEKAGGSWGGLLGELAQAGLSAVSTVAGVVLLALTVMSLYGFAAVVLSPSPAPPAPLGSWPGQVEALGPAATGLRQLAGVGLLLAAAQAHALLDFADHVRRGPQPGDLEALKRLMVEYLVRTKDGLHKYYLPGPWTFNALNASFVAAAALQAFFMLRAPGLGVDVNWDGALWGPMYGTCALTMVYALVVLLTFDWRSFSDFVMGFFVWAGNMVLDFFNAFVWKFDWAERRRRV